MAANEARTLATRRHRRSLVELRPDSVEPLADPAAEIDRLDLVNALARLDPRDRTLVALRYAADLDSDEIGSLVHLSASGVRSRLARTLHRLRKDLEHE